MASKQYDNGRLLECGKDVFISQNVEIRRPELLEIGDHVAIDSGFYLTTQAKLGDYIHIAPYVTIIGGAKGIIKMGHFSTIAAGSRIITGSDGHMGEGLVGPTIPEPYKDLVKHAPVIFCDFVNIGTNVVVHPGVVLAEGSVVGSMSLLTRSTEPWTIYAGIPARPIKERPRDKMIDYSKELGYSYSESGLVKIMQKL